MHEFIGPDSQTGEFARLTEFDALVAADPIVLDAIPGAVCICDHEGRLVSYNREAMRLWGRAAAAGSPLERICGSQYEASQEPLAQVSNPISAALSRGIATEGAEVIMETTDGTRLMALANVRPLRDFNGGIQGAIGCFRKVPHPPAADLEHAHWREQLEDFFDNSVVAMHIVDEAGVVVRANKAELAMMGYREDEYIGRPIMDFHADVEVISDILARLRRGETLQDHPARLRTKGGTVRYVKVSSSGRFFNGKFRNSRCCTVDFTRQWEMEQKIRDGERQMRDLLAALPAAVYTTDTRGRITYFNEAAALLAGRRPTLGVDEWCVSWKLYHSDGSPLPHDQCPMAICLLEGRPVRNQQAILERPDGTRVPFAPYPTPLRDGDGNLIGAINMLVDIAEQKKADERQKTLIAELNHRVKNSLATVQSLTRRTARNAIDVREFADNLEARVIALARAHDLLSKSYWDGISFGTLLHEIVSPFVETEGRLILDGESISVRPQAALSLTMALNELATNAAKYGALHGAHGSVHIRWNIRGTGDPVFELDWVESGGPGVAERPEPGFGIHQLSRCVERDLNGQCDLRFEIAGVHCRFTIPLSELN